MNSDIGYLDSKWVCFGFFMFFVALLLPDISFASEGPPVEAALCRAVNLLTGRLGQGIATLIIASLGVMLFFGKVSWGLAVITAVGMGALFSAPQIVQLLTDSSLSVCTEYKN